MNLRKLKWLLVTWALCDLLIGYAGLVPLGLSAAAQFTTVSGTVTDPNGIPYAFGTVVPLLIFTGGSPIFTATGTPYIQPLQAAGLDSTGHFTVTLADNTQLSPANTKWNFTVCSAQGSVGPAFGKGPVCFFLAAPITISGASQDISTQLNAAAVALTVPFASGALLSLNNTWTGNNTWIVGQNTLNCLNFESVLCVGTGGYATPEAAVAALPASPQGSQIFHSRVSTTSAGFTLGNTGCPDSFEQLMVFDPGAKVTLNGKITGLCNTRLIGQGQLGPALTTGGSFPSGTFMIDLGDNLAADNATVEGLKINCNSITTCGGIRGRGLNDASGLRRNLIQNYLTNGISLDGTAQTCGGFDLSNNFILAATGASDGITATNCQYVTFARNTEASNSGAAIAAAGIHFLGTASPSVQFVYTNHVEKHTDGVLDDGANYVAFMALDGTNSLTNQLHIPSTATGGVCGMMARNNNNGGTVIKNDVTGYTTENGTNPPARDGVIPFYCWINGGPEWYADMKGVHINNPTSGGAGSIGLSVSTNSANNDAFEIIDSGATPETLDFGPGIGGAFFYAIRQVAGAGSPRQLYQIANTSPFLTTFPIGGIATTRVAGNPGVTTDSIKMVGTAPTCTFTSGGGTSPSCTVDTGSADSGGIIIATTGTGAPALTGTITLTFSGTFGTNKPSCVYMASENGAGQWGALATFSDKTPAVASDLFNWTNATGATPAGVALATSSAYWINYHCFAK